MAHRRRTNKKQGRSPLIGHSMQVIVRMSTGRKELVKTSLRTTVADFKQALGDKIGVPKEKQLLSLEHIWKPLRDELTMADYNIQNMKTTLLLRVHQGPLKMQFDITTCTGGTVMIVTSMGELSVSTIKKKIEKSSNIPTSVQSIVNHEGDKLQDQCQIMIMKIKTNSRSISLQFPIKVHIPALSRYIDVTPKRTVFSVKKEIQKEIGIKVDEQSLYFEGTRLQNFQILDSLGIAYGSTLKLHVYTRDIVDVFQDAQEKYHAFSVQIAKAQSLLLDHQKMVESAISLSSLDAAAVVAIAESNEIKSRHEEHLSQFRATTVLSQNMINQTYQLSCQREEMDQAKLTQSLNDIAEQKQKAKLRSRLESQCCDQVLLRRALNAMRDHKKNILSQHLVEAELSTHELDKGEYELRKAIENKMMEIEKGYNEWSVKDTTKWISMIEKGHFGDPKFNQFMDNLEKMNIDGQQLAEFNNKFAFQMAGLKKVEDQSVLRKHMNRVIECESENNICGICVSNKVDTVMIPCGHQYHCHQCSQRMTFQQRRMCPVCRRSVSQIIRTFMSGFPDR